MSTAYERAGTQQLKTSPVRRLRYWASRVLGTRLQKSQKVYFVTLNGETFKRIVLRDSFLASEIETRLERFGNSDRFPGLIQRYEHEVWVDFVDGEIRREPDEESTRAIADFYADLYACAPRRVASAETVFVERLDRNLAFLKRVGVIPGPLHGALHREHVDRAPAELWLGFDYTDPVLKNFVTRPDGRICGIDVESLECDLPIGTGFAKANVRWLTPPLRKLFLEHVVRPGAPDFRPELPFIETAFLAHYTAMMFLEQKWRNVEPEAFERLCGEA